MRALVVAKAPVPGRVKTRLGAAIGMDAAARLAAAALLDTIAACRSAFAECHLALDGDLDEAVRVRRAASQPRRLDRAPAARRRARGASGQRPRGCRRSRADRPGRHGHPAAHGVRSAPRSSRRPRTATPCSARLPTAGGGCWRSATRPPRPSWPAYRCRSPTPSPRRAMLWSRAGQSVRVGHELTDVDTVARGRARRGVPDRGPLPPRVAGGDGMTTLPLASVYTHALRGHPCTLWEGDLAPRAASDPRLAGPGRARPTSHSWPTAEGPTVDIGCGPGRMSEALALAGHTVLGIDVVPEAVRQTRTRGVPALRRERLRPDARRGPVGARPCSPTATSGSAGTRSPCWSARASWSRPTAASSSTSRPGGPASSRGTSGSRPDTAGAGSSRGPRSAPTPSRPWRPPPGWGARPRTGTTSAGGPCVEAAVMKTPTLPRVPDERDFTSWLRSPAVTARVGLWLGICFGVAFVTGLISHWAQTPVTVAAVPDRPELGLPGDPGSARHLRDRRGAAAAGQAVDRLPQARRPGPRA